jgi:glycogen synthase
LQRHAPIYYAAVAGDILGTYLRWKEGRADERQTAATYSGQFFDLCTRAGRRGVASFPSSERKKIEDPQFSVHNRPFSRLRSGVWFYCYQLSRALWLFLDVIRSRASDVIVMDGVTYFFLLAPIAWSGRRVFLSVHTVPWQKVADLNSVQRVISRLDGWFIRRHCAGCLVASPVIARQITRLTKNRSSPIMFYPTYDRGSFDEFAPSNSEQRPFRIFYAGRIEVDKGVFDLLQSFRELHVAGRNVHLDYCGDGEALLSLRERIVGAGLSDHVKTHGHLNRSAYLQLLNDAQIVVVPTRSSFPEGLNQVVIEAVLARRPVVTSAVCPALELVSPAAVEAEVDDVESYTRAIEKLIDDPKLYSVKALAADGLRESFFDPSQGWAAKANSLLAGGASSGGL